MMPDEQRAMDVRSTDGYRRVIRALRESHEKSKRETEKARMEPEDANAKRIAELEAENERLREGLKPFAEWAREWNQNWPDTMRIDETELDQCPTLGDCRRAAELLAHAANSSPPQ